MKSAINEPLLYISQPEFDTPVANMQADYSSDTLEMKKNTSVKKQYKKQSGSFQQLSIHEKVNYLLQFPVQTTPLKCEVKTESETMHGVIIRIHDDQIELRMYGKMNRWIKLDEIKNIQLLGF